MSLYYPILAINVPVAVINVHYMNQMNQINNNNQNMTMHYHRRIANGNIDKFETMGPCQACGDQCEYWSNTSGHARHGK